MAHATAYALFAIIYMTTCDFDIEYLKPPISLRLQNAAAKIKTTVNTDML